MGIALSTEQMMHICKLLREDVMCSEQLLYEEPDDLEAALSLGMSRQIMLMVASSAILKEYGLKENNDTERLQERNRFN